MTKRKRTAVCLLVAACCASGRAGLAQTPDLTRLSLEDLLNLEITSVARKEQTLARTAAAVYVITREDIRRSGARTIPDLLRMAPGLSVARFDAGSWAISARGFNGLFVNKLLVLLDGRSLYSPAYGGVHWDMVNVPLDDVERIEVIRGPGGTLWGANAVNGVINIITASAEATQGGRLTAGAGSRGQWTGDARYGARLGGHGAVRAYGSHVNLGTGLQEGSTISPMEDRFHRDTAEVTLGGVRVDWHDEANRVTVHGTVQDGEARHLRTTFALTPPVAFAASRPSTFTDGSLVGEWTRSHAAGARTSVQAAYQDYERLDEGIAHRWHIGDVELRHQRAVGRRQEVVAGAGYRSTASVTAPDRHGFGALPAHERTNLFTGFLNHEIDILRGTHVILGAKVEHNAYSGFEAQPSARLNWTGSSNHAAWAAVTRAVRTPTQLDRSVRWNGPNGTEIGGLPVVQSVEGSTDYLPEHLDAVEGGYRWTRGALALDLAIFRNEYDRLRALEIGAPRPSFSGGQPVLVVPGRFINLLEATAYGGEVAATWQPASWWKAAGSYSRLRLTVRNPRGPSAAVAPFIEARVPGHQFHARTFLDLPGNLEVGALLYGASANDTIQIDAYTKLDLTVRWRVRPRLDVAITGQNLFHDGDREFSDPSTRITWPVRTSLFVEAGWRF